ncbi:MAG TPA: hypothetical protein VFT19_12860 [Solirubrobacterales bacterium]|nr:hypothetical protein [Solirubrobacterales bacterium]
MIALSSKVPSALRTSGCAALAFLCLAFATPSAEASFGFDDLDVTFNNPDGSPALQAGAHPYSLTVTVGVNTKFDAELGYEVPDEAVRDITVAQMPGLVGKPTATPRCTIAEFSAFSCPASSQIGVNYVTFAEPDNVSRVAVYNLVPPPRVAQRFGFHVSGVPVTIELGLSESFPANVIASVRNISNAFTFYHSRLTIWGVPADPRHDAERAGGAIDAPEQPLLTAPRSCEGPQATLFSADTWQRPGVLVEAPGVLTHDGADPPNPQGFTGCARLGFSPTIAAQPTTKAASSPTGLDFSIDVDDEGLANPTGLANSDIKKAVVTLPVGFTANPSVAEGLSVCSEAQREAETALSAAGAGCPEASKVGTVEVQTPLLEESVNGAVYIAKPYENEFHSLLALYIVIKNPTLGILVTQAVKIEPHPITGQLIATTENIPQLPFSHFRLHFREGGRSPLVSPPACGAYDGHDPTHEPVKAVLTPWSGGPPITTTSTFQIVAGPDEGPCRPNGTPPFDPGFEAGTINNAAGAYSPFAMRITRGDGMQDLSKFSAVLPPGVVGRIAGIPWCPEAGIAQAKSRTGEDGGTQELRDPSCPAASQVGRTVAGAGVGSQLTYVPGSLYLAGPYNGSPLSVVSITPAVAGPFDGGVVVVRVALDLNPKTGVVEVDGAASDPIPHILQGIPLNVRDLRVYVDRPDLTLNATSCEEENTFATIWGAGTVFDPAGETPVGRTARYQAAGCASLGFSPKLGIKLKGGVRRGAHPALRAVVTPRPGDANFERAVVTLPRSAFLDQAHIRTICTRVQFAAGPGNGALCPPGAQYGYARAWSPLLDAPAQGPVYLRSSDNKLPDLVVALKGPASAPVDVELSARIDSVRGGIRSTFAGIPDLPVSRFILDMQGGKKGLIVNSRHLCHKPGRNRARSNIRGQNGRFSKTKPRVIALTCAKRRKAKKRRNAKRASVSRALIAERAGSGR